jgi:hypothetical protein
MGEKGKDEFCACREEFCWALSAYCLMAMGDGSHGEECTSRLLALNLWCTVTVVAGCSGNRASLVLKEINRI